MESQLKSARPFAKALFEVSLRLNTCAECVQGLARLQILCAQPSVQALCKMREVSTEQITEVFSSLISDPLEPYLQALLQLLLRQRRIDHIDAIATLYQALYWKHQGILPVKVITAEPLEAVERQHFADKLTQFYGAQLAIDYLDDPSLIGGFKLYQGDHLIDDSVLGQLTKLKHEFKA